MSDPYDPFGSPPSPGGAGQEPFEPAGREASPSIPTSGYGQPAEPAQPSVWGQPSAPDQDPYGRPPAVPSQPFTSGQYGQPGEQPGALTPPIEQPATPSQSFPSYSSPYAPPAAPSQPLAPGQYPYGAPSAPSQPFSPGQYPYGPPSVPLQPWQTMPGQQPAPPWGPVSQTLPGMVPPGVPAFAAPKKSRRTLWIALSVAAALLLLTAGGGAFAFTQYVAPAAAAGTFCGHLKAQDYSSAYAMFSSSLQSQSTQDQFVQGAQALDKIEGAVLRCGQATGGNAYTYSLFGSTAQVNAVITRATAGDLQGVIHLKSENGAWKVDALDTGLLGINLGALQAAGAFCTALQTQNYTTAYGLLGTQAQTAVKQTDFVNQAQLHDQIDGNISACGLVAIDSGASDTSAGLTASISRSKLGEKQGKVTLDVESGAWKISTLADALLGSDLGPLQIGTRFCADLASGNFADAYKIVSHGFLAGQSEADFAASWTPPPGTFKWGGCTPDLSTYKVSGSDASYNAGLKAVDLSTSQSGTLDVTFSFIQENGDWKLDNITKA